MQSAGARKDRCKPSLGVRTVKQQRDAHPAEVQPLDRAALHPHAGTAALRPLDASQRVEIVERPAGAVPVGEGEEQQPGHADE